MLIPNSNPAYGLPLDAIDAQTLSAAAAREIERFLHKNPDHKPTPMVELETLAAQIGVGGIYLKDESVRSGLGSFKALGGAYAVTRLVLEEATRQLSRPLEFVDLFSADVRAIARQMTFGCATDGNHGRSVAYGARTVGSNAVIFIHEGVSEERAAAIAHFGAEVIRIAGTYDDSVREASRICDENGWTVVSDTSWPGYERVPSLVMQGYTAIASELLRQMAVHPTHLFVQAGVGGLAASLAGHFAVLFGGRRPRVVVVEPERAACLFQSMIAGKPTKIAHAKPTVMAMLECCEPSYVGWRILARTADAFMTVGEGEAIDAMRTLARPQSGDRAIVSGESGAVGLAGLLRVANNPELRSALQLSDHARVLVINTEGATDIARYKALMGFTPESVG